MTVPNEPEQAPAHRAQNHAGLPRTLPRGLPDRQAHLLALLATRPSITRASYQLLAGIGHNTAHHDLAELEHLGLIQRAGSGPATRYYLADPSDLLL